MLSLNHDNDNDIPVAIIKDNYEYGGEIVYLNPEGRSTGETDVELDEGSFIPIPNPFNDSNVYFLVGPRGSGKTYMSVNLATMYNRQHPTNRIYIITENATSPQNQELYRRLENVVIIKLDKSIVTQPIKLDELQNALVIFDDFATMDSVDITTTDDKGKKKTKKVKLSEVIDQLRDKVIQNGRHHNIDVIICEHMLFGYKRTRQTLEELNYLVYYKDTGMGHVKRYLKDFLGLDKYQIQNILKRKSRWTLVCKNSPRYVLTENECFMIKDKVDTPKPKSAMKKIEDDEPEDDEESEGSSRFPFRR